MCGFFITNISNINDSHEEIIEKTLRFRGPDGSSGLKQVGEWKSYHARLSIIDLTEGTNQPVINADGSQLVFNGEILNYVELGIKYFGKRYSSDTFLLNDLILSGNLKLNELDGFYAFVFINGRGLVEYACRDKFGVKPLYYYKKDNGIAFCSEVSTLKSIFNCTKNEKSIEEYQVFRAPIFQGAFYNEIKQVEPGSCYVKGMYFNVTEEIIDASFRTEFTNKSQKLRDALKRGVRSRCVSDAPIGLLLSKGVDSNLIRHLGEFERFYSIGFDGDEDINYLQSQSIQNLTVIKVTIDEFLEAFQYLIDLRQEPMSVPNEVMLYLIARRAKTDGVKVLLSGEGADEFFAGYDRIFTWASSTERFSIEEFLEYYAYKKPEKNSHIYKYLEDIFTQCGVTTSFDKVRWFFVKYHLPILFRRLDFALMAAGVEGREPIANDHLFSLSMMFRDKELMKNGLGKIPLRKILSEYMGDDFAFENKIGFPVDLTKIFLEEKELSSYDIWFKKNLEVLT